MHRTLCIWLLSIIGQESAAAVIDSVKLNPDLNKKALTSIDEVFYYWYLYRDYVQWLANINPDEYLKDADGDGVANVFDKEPNSVPFDAVDIDGVSNDFDHDGCPDSVDPEPDSSPVLPMEDCVNTRPADTWPDEYVSYQLFPGVTTYFETPMIFFDEASSAIRPDAVPVLNQLSDIFTRYRANIGISSYVSQGDTAQGMSPSQLTTSRLTSIIQYLIEKGVQPDQLYVKHRNLDDMYYIKKISDDSFDAVEMLNRSAVFEVLLSED